MYEKKTALQKAKDEADALDRRRQHQIQQQAVRMDNMKQIILSMAAEIQEKTGEDIDVIIGRHTK